MSRTRDLRALRTALGIYLLGVLVLIVGLVVTFLLWHGSLVNAYTRRNTLFNHYVEQAGTALRNRIAGYAALVQSGQGVFAASDSVQRLEWRA
ncbi:MAG TPA: hypothetical protein VFM15_01955, partial [Gammaproteobacteria bacterium]|nr:hypothetical protein [Gammaproteobacteria bacterium]